MSTLAVDRTLEGERHEIPSTMRAAVYRGVNNVRLEEVPVLAIGPGRFWFAYTLAGSADRS